MVTAKRPKPQRIVTQSAAEKAARAGLLQSAQLGLAAMAGRVATATRGAFSGSRKLRHAGDTLQRYNMGNYSDTLGGFYPTPPSGPPGGGSSGAPPKLKPKPKPKPRSGTGGSTSTTARRGGGTGGSTTTTDTARRDARRKEMARQQKEAARRAAAAQARREHTSTRSGKTSAF